ncbi:AdoMet-dependent rRNA methyltransferase spb1, partial [Modicella reniformis]
VLQDDASNIGSAWVHDNSTHSELILQSLKLTTEFLSKRGWFINKAFQPEDYNKLMWGFQQLFRKVEATKPYSSRNVSVEYGN